MKRFGDRHLEHIGDARRSPRGSGMRHFKRLCAIASAVAVAAAEVHIRQELHLDMLEAAAAAGRTAPGAGVETEGARGPAALARLWQLRETLAYHIEGTDIARRVGAGGASDRRLVDGYDIGDGLGAAQSSVCACGL